MINEQLTDKENRLMSTKIPPAEHVAKWSNGTPIVEHPCTCGQTVAVQGVTTVAGALAALAAAGCQH